jgi:hypothetical protein
MMEGEARFAQISGWRPEHDGRWANQRKQQSGYVVVVDVNVNVNGQAQCRTRFTPR